MTVIIDGKALAAQTHEGTRMLAEKLAARGVTPCLAIIRVGDDEPSRVYVAAKQKAAATVGIETRQYELPATATTAEIIHLLKTIDANTMTHGVIVQMPLPPQVDTMAVLAALPVAKDVDGLSPANLGNLFVGAPCFTPATPQGCMLLVKSVAENISGKNALVLGRSRLVGKPVAQLLLAENCTVTTAHSKTQNLKALCQQADIIIAAMGQPAMVQADWIKQGAIVIDVGITRTNGKLTGDVDTDAVINAGHAAAITPVPGGVGPMTIACLLRNTVYACSQQNGVSL